MHREAKRAAVTERIHLGPVTGLADEGIITRDTAVVVEQQHFAPLSIGILRVVAGGRHEQRAVATEREA